MLLVIPDAVKSGRMRFASGERNGHWAVWVVAALGGSAESWLQMQAAYDLWHAARKQRAIIQPLKLAA